MKKVLMLFIAASVIFGLNSCKKDHEEVEINMTSPEAGKTYPNTGTLAITGTISGDEVDDVEIKIKKKSTGEMVFEFDKHVHAKSYTINETWTWDAGSITEATVFEIEIHVKSEHGGGEHFDLEYEFTIAP
jgi:hypothetical protein